jgi:hypothetical protein
MTKKCILIWLVFAQATFSLFSQSHSPQTCAPCNKYLYWTGEFNNDFFQERNWRVAVQLPSPPNVPDSARLGNFGKVKPSCLPGANKMAHQICFVEPDLEKDKHPIPGSINPGEPIRYNLYAANASLEANGDILFESDHTGITVDAVQFEIEGSLTNGVFSIGAASTIHFRTANPLGGNSILNFLDNESWVYLHEKNPDEVLASASTLWVNDTTASVDGNIRVNQYYFKGSLIRGKSADYTPLTIHSVSQASASLNESIIYSGSNIPSGLNNQTNSFVLKRGYMATFASNDNGTGKSKVYIASEQDLMVTELPAALQGNISFIRVLPWNWVTKKGNGGFKPGVDAGWFYNWNNNQTSKPNYEYVPMAWGAGGASFTGVNLVINKDKTTHLLGFNESDNCDDQSGKFNNLCKPEVAVAYYENLMSTGVRLGTPAPRENGPTSWLREFSRIAKERDVRFDFVAVHWYDWGSNPANSPYEDPQKVFNRFKSYLANVYNIYGLPIWITEFNANPNRDNSVQAAFLQLALPYLEQLDYVERYAYFEPMAQYSSNVVEPSNLFDTNGNLTNIGTIYKDHPSSASIPELTYNSPNNLEGMNVPYVEIPTEVFSFEAECGLYKGNKWEVKEDTVASSQYYIQGNAQATGATALAEQIHFEFESTEAKTQRLWVRLRNLTGSNGAIKVKMDDQEFETHTGMNSASYQWFRIPRYFNLSAGKHRVTIGYVNAGTLVDQIAFVNSSATVNVTPDGSNTVCTLPVKSWGIAGTDVTYWAEAESAFAGSEWQQGSEESAIGGKFMQPTAGVSAIATPPGTAGQLRFEFDIAADDEYTIWGKIQALNEISDAFWFSVDGEPFRKWDGLQNKVYQWHWQKFYFSEGSTNRNFNYFLAEGHHTIVVAYAEGGSKLDRIAVASTQRNPALEDPNVLLKDPVMEFEAETATLLGAPVVANCAVASNGKLVNPSGNINNGIRFSNVGITNAGNYRLTIAYISKDTRNFKLIVNGVDLGTNSNFSVLPSGNWCFEANPRTADWHRVIALNAGANTIEIKTISTSGNTNAPFIDKISLVREFVSFEAEQARLVGDVTVEACARASNGLNVNLRTSTTNSVIFEDVFVDESATYFVDFHYVSKVARTARIIINGVSETISFEASGNWCFEAGPSNAPKVKSLLRALNIGANRIEIKTSGGEAPVIDKISVLKQPSKASSNARISRDEPIVVVEKIEATLVYPNPLSTNNDLNVYVPSEQDGNFELQILDVSGRSVYQSNSGKLNQHMTLQPQLHSGMFILIINHGDNRYIKKLIVTHQ